MFRRILFEDWIALFPLIAFITAASVYLTIAYRAIRMRRPQIDALSNLPFHDEPASSRHDVE